MENLMAQCNRKREVGQKLFFLAAFMVKWSTAKV
jgi:hypothetical protein